MAAYQFRIDLDYDKHEVWRQIAVPDNLNFAQFAVIINFVIGWTGSHLSMFRLKKSGLMLLAMMDYAREDDVPMEKCYLQDVVDEEKLFTYIYDFGADWQHRITFEKKIAEYDENFPWILEGQGNCPPEDDGRFDSLFDIDKANAMLKKFFAVSNKKIDRRTFAEIYDDFGSGEYGLFGRLPKRRKNYLAPEEEAAAPTFSLVPKSPNQKPETLGDIYKELSNEDVIGIGQYWHMDFDKHGDTREGFIKALLEKMLRPGSLESVLLSLSDEEVESMRRLVAAGDNYVDTEEDDFSSLLASGYMVTDNDGRLVTSDDIKRTFLSLMGQPSYHDRRRRMGWFEKCIMTGYFLYGAFDFDLLLKLHNQHPTYQIEKENLPRLIGFLSQNVLFNISVDADGFYDHKQYLSTKDGLSKQENIEPYIPTIEEMDHVSDIEFMLDEDYIEPIIRFFSIHSNMDGDTCGDILMDLADMTIKSADVTALMSYLKKQNILKGCSSSELSKLRSLLNDLREHTRMLRYRGHTPAEAKNMEKKPAETVLPAGPAEEKAISDKVISLDEIRNKRKS